MSMNSEPYIQATNVQFLTVSVAVGRCPPAVMRLCREAICSHLTRVQFPRERSSCQACTPSRMVLPCSGLGVDRLATVVNQDGLGPPSGFMPTAASRLMQVA